MSVTVTAYDLQTYTNPEVRARLRLPVAAVCHRGAWTCVTLDGVDDGCSQSFFTIQNHRTPPDIFAAGADLGLGRIVASEIEIPNMLVNLV